MDKTFEQLVKEIETMHTQMKPIYDSRPITGKRIAIERNGKEPVDAIMYRPKLPASSRLLIFLTCMAVDLQAAMLF